MALMLIPPANVSTNLFEFLVASHRLGRLGFYGRDHWLRVLQNGRLPAAETGANLQAVEH